MTEHGGTEITFDTIQRSLVRHLEDSLSLRPLDHGSADVERFPEQWLPIITSSDPQARRDAALGLWNDGLLERLPRFSHELRTSLRDVRACFEHESAALVYVLTDSWAEYVTWVGYDPRLFTAPPLWDHFPADFRVFLTEVHAGFVTQDYDSFGVMQPRHMRTIAEILKTPVSIEDYDSVSEIACGRMVEVSTDGGNRYYVSPDTPGKLVVKYGADVDPEDFYPTWDELLMDQIEYGS